MNPLKKLTPLRQMSVHIGSGQNSYKSLSCLQDEWLQYVQNVHGNQTQVQRPNR